MGEEREKSRRELEQEVEQLRSELTSVQEQAGEALKRLHLAIQQTDDVIFITDPEGHIVYANPAFKKVYGYKWEETLGATPRILNSGRMDKGYYQEFWSTISSGEKHTDVHINRTKDGRLVRVRATVNPVIIKGEIEGYVSVQQDVTEQEEARESLRLSEQMKRTLLDAIPHTILQVDASGTILSLNREIPGCSKEGVTGKKLDHYLSPQDSQGFRRALEAARKSGQKQTFELPGSGSGGPYRVRLTGLDRQESHQPNRRYLLIIDPDFVFSTRREASDLDTLDGLPPPGSDTRVD